MRELSVRQIEDAVCELFQTANRKLPCDLAARIADAAQAETEALPRAVMEDIAANLTAADEMHVPICQDTGMAVLFCDLGPDVHLVGGDFTEAVNRGVARAYRDGYLRCSVVADPIRRGNTGDNTPAVIHLRLVPGDRVKLTAAPKGFGSENMSALRMFTPSATVDEIEDFIVSSVRSAGGNPCPPVVLGVGIGGDFEQCAVLPNARCAVPFPSGTPTRSTGIWRTGSSKNATRSASDPKASAAKRQRCPWRSKRRRRISPDCPLRSTSAVTSRVTRKPFCEL